MTAGAPFYGLLVFAEATANEASLVPVERSDAAGPQVKVWAAVDRGGTLRLLVMNKNPNTAAEVNLHARGFGPEAVIKRLAAPSAGAVTGFTYAGQTYDGSTDGNPVGKLQQETAPAGEGSVSFKAAACSAVLVTLVSK